MAKHHSNAAKLNDSLRTEIAAMLLTGVDIDVAAQRVASRGIAFGVARAEVERAAKSPYFAALADVAARLGQRIAKRDWLLQNHRKLVDVIDHGDVPRTTTMPAAVFFADHYRRHSPVIVTGLVDHWPARQWSLAYLEQLLGAMPVRVQWNRESDSDYERNSDAHGTTRPFGEIAQRLRASETAPTNDFYVTANNHAHNRQALAALYRDVGDMPDILAPPGGSAGFVWIGPRGTITPWHHDLTNNLLLQLVGRKRVRLVGSQHIARMRNSRHCFSDWGTEALDVGPGDAEHPPVMIADIGPGEALFLPVGWWHHVEGLDITIGMSFTNFAADNDFWSHYSTYGDV